MPNLYGNPRKDELRARIRELNTHLSARIREHHDTRRSLELTRARNSLLTKRVESLEAKLKDLLAEVSQEISSKEVVEEAQRLEEARREAEDREYESSINPRSTNGE